MSDTAFLLDDFPPVPTEAWEAAIEADLKGADYDKTLVWQTLDGIAVRPYYRAEDLARLAHDPAAVAGQMAPPAPGAPPGAWRIRQDLAAPDVATASVRAREAVEGGATDLGLVLDVGADGLRGLPVQTAADLARLLEGLDLARVGLHLDGGAATPALLAMLLAAADRLGADPALLLGSAGDDVFARLAARGSAAVEPAIAALAGLLRGDLPPGLALVTATTAPYHAAGAGLVQETGCLLAAASEYFARLAEAGVAPADVAQRLQFVVHVGPSFFPEIARVRALRLVWPQLLAAYAPEADPAPVQIQAVTSAVNQTVYDPHVNLLRATTEAAAAVLGGCDVLAVRPFDEAYRRPGGFSLRLARNLQLILKHEAALDRVRDAAAGAYYVEVLTDRLAAEAWLFFQEIERRGGLVAALEQGFVHEQVGRVRQQREKDFALRKRVLVGINNYANAAEQRLPDLEPAPAPQPILQTGTPVALDAADLAGSLRAAFAAGATLGDALAALETGKAATVAPLPTHRLAEPFEALRLRTEEIARARGRVPSVFLLPVGDPVMRTARATFSANFFGAAGFAVTSPPGFEGVEAGVEAVRAAGPDVVVLCSADEAYAELAPALCAALKTGVPAPIVVVAGAPEGMEALRAAGVDDFVHRRSPILETLRSYQDRLGAEA